MSKISENELLALLRLHHVPLIGDIVTKKLLERCGSAEQVFKERKDTLSKIDGIGSMTLKGLWDAIHLQNAEKELRFINDAQIQYYYYKDENYPNYLSHCIDGPVLLFQRGIIDFADKKVISIVGTRNMSNYGVSFLESFMEAIVPFDPIIVSGFAYGVDIAAQRLANEKGLQTIGCLAHGLNQMYPKPHKKYVAQIEGNGGFVTEFWSSSNPDRENFLKRNRIIAGMSEATVVVESAEKGGSLVTADLAYGYNRDVFAVPGRFSDKWSVGCNNLIKQQKAHVLTSAADLIYMLGWDLPNMKAQPVQKTLFVELDETEKKIYDYLRQHGKQLLDSVALECGLPIFKTSSSLLTMEMKGVVRPLPGKLFEII